jgi:hypothetical protein
VAYWANVDAELGAKVAAGLGIGNGGGPDAAASPEATELLAERANRA